jgi:hypothetical protein
MGRRIEIPKLLNGLGPMVLLGSAPSFGVFFGLYGPTKMYLERDWDRVLSPFAQVLAASVFASVPTSLVGVPADVLKKHMMATGESFRGALNSLVGQHGARSLITGWRINVARDVPFVAVKMTLYEGILRQYLGWRQVQGVGASHPTAVRSEKHSHGSQGVSSAESAMVGFVSGMLTAVATQPLDVLNTRSKTSDMAGVDLRHVLLSQVRSGGYAALFRGLAPRILITGLGSTVFWFLYSSVQQTLTPFVLAG